MNNKLYDGMKSFTMIILPTGTAVIAGTGNTLQIATGMAAINALLGIFLISSSKGWHANESNFDGEMAIVGNDPDTGLPELKLTVTTDPNEYSDKRTIRFKSIDQR